MPRTHVATPLPQDRRTMLETRRLQPVQVLLLEVDKNEGVIPNETGVSLYAECGFWSY